MSEKELSSVLSDDVLVYIGTIPRETRAAWAELCAGGAGDPWDLDEGDRTWITLAQAAVMFFYLRNTADLPVVFPKGKLASLQLFESLIDEAIKKSLRASLAEARKS